MPGTTWARYPEATRACYPVCTEFNHVFTKSQQMYESLHDRSRPSFNLPYFSAGPATASLQEPLHTAQVRLAMCVTLITQGSELNGSAYYRALQFAPLLAERGLAVVSAPAAVPERRLGGRAGAALLLAEHGLCYASRASELRRLVARSDVLMVQRGAYPIGPSLLLGCVERFTGRVIYDLDDAIFLPTPTLAHRRRLARWVYEDRQASLLLERADTVIVSTDELGDALPGRRADAVLPTIPDVWSYPTAVQRREGPLRLGWIGSSGNLRYLEPLRDALARLAGERVASLEVVSDLPWSGAASFRAWQRASEAQAVAGFEVGLMPLPDTAYTRAKAGFKLLQYMAAGCAVIASPVGINRWLVEQSGAGVLASSAEEWELAIRELAADRERRTAHAISGQRFVRAFADRSRHADVLAAAIRGESLPAAEPLPSGRQAGDGS